MAEASDRRSEGQRTPPEDPESEYVSEFQTFFNGPAQILGRELFAQHQGTSNDYRSVLMRDNAEFDYDPLDHGVGPAQSRPSQASFGSRARRNFRGKRSPDEENNHSLSSDLELNSSDLESDTEAPWSRRQRNRWIREAKEEVKMAFGKLPQRTGTADPAKQEVYALHNLDLAAQIIIANRKRRLEECGVVFCTVDISPSRDAFCTWIQQEVAEKTKVQIKHVRILAARHYLVVLHSLVDRDTVLAGGPYYLRRRMVYTTPWEPGFDTSKVLAKKMACWLDLVDVDPLLEGESWNLLATLGEVIQCAGMTEHHESKFANIRGCVLIDMTKPLCTILTIQLGGEVRQIEIQYDVLPDACFQCHERGHIARVCPLTTTTTVLHPKPAEKNSKDNFIKVTRKDPKKGKEAVADPGKASTSNRFDALEVEPITEEGQGSKSKQEAQRKEDEGDASESKGSGPRKPMERGQPEADPTAAPARSEAEKNQSERATPELQKDLSRARENITLDATSEQIEALAKLETEVRDREILEANIVRRRSRVQWIREGEASTKFFFNCLRSKQAQDKIGALYEEDGSLITDEEGTMDRVMRYYSSLYAQPETEDGSGQGTWKNIAQELASNRIPLNTRQLQEINIFQEWIRRITLDAASLQGSRSWRWKNQMDVWKGWNRTTSFWSKLLTREETVEDLQSKWEGGLENMSWKTRWKLLWQKGGSNRTKLWTWKVLHRGFFTGERAEKMQVAEDPCKRCRTERETLNHLLWECTTAVPTWNRLREGIHVTGDTFHLPHTLLGSIDEALKSKAKVEVILQNAQLEFELAQDAKRRQIEPGIAEGADSISKLLDWSKQRRGIREEGDNPAHTSNVDPTQPENSTPGHPHFGPRVNENGIGRQEERNPPPRRNELGQRNSS
ncbi:hypothetical protein R1sor_012255 [Riccia sorocarpa]|uniref:CCHC-type domain-containing protein n=1 Tax=Riccia sorocarpa TaxID=122646 RepID=A0ABD3I9G1_9MARC